MRSIRFVCLFLIFYSLVITGSAISPTHSNAAHAGNRAKPGILSKPKAGAQGMFLQSYGRLPLSFERNQGQADPQVKFLSRGHDYTLFLTGDEAVFTLRGDPQARVAPPAGPQPGFSAGKSLLESDRKTDAHGRRRPLLDRKVPSAQAAANVALRMKLVNANSAAEVAGDAELPGKSNYFLGNDPAKWRTNVPTYAKVKYKDVYPGIDIVYYGNQRQLEYDFVVAPHADPRQIAFGIEGAKSVHRDARGDLVLQIAGSEIRWRKPVVYQEKDGKRHEIAGNYVIGRENQIGFEVASYDASRPLVIDPELIYSTYLGGSGDDYAAGVAIDASGNAYATGYTSSTDFPTKNAFQKNYGGGQDDAFVTKIDSAGTSIVYSTYMGGSDFDGGFGIAVDSSGAAYLTGETSSTDFPLMNPIQKTLLGGVDAFVTKLDATGSALVYSTYLGGNSTDQGNSITTDSGGNAYIAGETLSTNFPTKNPFQQKNAGAYDGFVTKINAKGTALVYSTYLGGSSGDGAASIAIDSAGHAYITGSSISTDFPTTQGAFQTQNNGQGDAFVTVFDAAGSALVYSTFLGGNNRDYASGIAVDSSGNAYVAGDTESTDFPITKNAYQGTYGGQDDAFVTVFNSTGSGLTYSTYLGGGSYDDAVGIALDSSGNIYVVGETESGNFPVTKDAFQGSFAGGSDDSFFSELTLSGSLTYSTYFGGSGNDYGYGIAVSSSTLKTPGGILLTGYTQSPDFPTLHRLQRYAGNSDGFVAKFALAPEVTLTPPHLHFALQKLHTTSKPKAVTLTNTGEADLHITNIAASGDFAETNSCPVNGSLAPGKKCEIDVTFTPTMEGPRSGDVKITDDAPTSPQKLPLTGIGGAPLVGLFPPTLEFGNQTVNITSSPKNTTLTNTGNITLHITSITITGADSGDFAQSNNCDQPIQPNNNCQIKVTFTPSTTGQRTAQVTITDDAPDSPQQVPLSGVGVLPAVEFNPKSLTFPTQLVYTSSPAKKVTLTNTGKGILLIHSLVLKGQFFESNDCGKQVQPGAHCTITVKFHPRDKGPLQGSLTLTDNAADSPQQVPLSGTGTFVQLVPRDVHFGTQPVGTESAPRAIRLTNKGGSAVNIQGISITGADPDDFSETNDCGSQVASGASCTIKVRFTPSQKGKRTADVSISDDGGGSPQAVKLTGFGT